MISLEEYLRTSYDPEVEFVDGELVERHAGEWAHALTFSNILYRLGVKYPQFYVLPSLTIQTAATRYRIPDISIFRRRDEAVPLLVAEVVSEIDSVYRMLQKLEEFALMGVANIWLIEPRLRKIFAYTNSALQEITSEIIATGNPQLELTRDEIFRR